MEHGTILRKKDGSIKYYASVPSVWNAAIRLNEKLPAYTNGAWYFEGDETGNWFLHFLKDGE